MLFNLNLGLAILFVLSQLISFGDLFPKSSSTNGRINNKKKTNNQTADSFVEFLKANTNSTKLNNNSLVKRVHELEFDFLIFRQIWPASSCMFPGHNTCSIGSNVTSWVIHGLWPTIENTLRPNFCNRSKIFSLDSIKSLLPVLLEYWPNLYTNTPLESFWKHEWDKHGTCALSLPQIKAESDYFNISLELRSNYDFGRILKANSIFPDDTMLYDLAKITNAIKNFLQIRPIFVCYFNKNSRLQYLSQMQICLSKNFQLMDCPEEYNDQRSNTNNMNIEESVCKQEIPVHYPTIKHQKPIS